MEESCHQLFEINVKEDVFFGINLKNKVFLDQKGQIKEGYKH